jgi:hypothetical protein
MCRCAPSFRWRAICTVQANCWLQKLMCTSLVLMMPCDVEKTSLLLYTRLPSPDSVRQFVMLSLHAETQAGVCGSTAQPIGC